jgi:hypothetical protein
MDKYKKIQILLLVILIGALLVFAYLMYSWNFAYSAGTFTSEDGVYTGEFKGKIFHGQGTFRFSTGIVYEGQWIDGRMEGYGTMIFTNGSKYEGQLEDGFFHGEGKMILEDGTVIDGIWDHGELIEIHN